MTTAYETLVTQQRELSALYNAMGILGWDRETMMPKGAAAGRAEQLAAMAAITHRMATDPKRGELMKKAASQTDLDEWQKRNLALLKHTYLRTTLLSEELVARTSRAESASLEKWEEAKAANNWAVWLPAFEEVLACSRETYALIGQKFGLSPYDAALDAYEIGNSVAVIKPLFDDLRTFLKDLLPKAVERQARQKTEGTLKGVYPEEKQKALCLQVMQALGFDANCGRLDVSAHPFCGGADGDVRITTRYRTDEFAPALFGLIHETGHALYEQSRPAAYAYQPVGNALGMMVHESQSLLMEMQVAQSPEFLEWVAPLVQKAFDLPKGAVTAALLRQELCTVTPGYIRVDADEVTYPLHIIIRTQLEEQLVNGSLSAKDARDAWNSAYADVLGLPAPDDKNGILQDVHWPGALIGYFPCYTQGAILAAQLFQTAVKAHPELRAEIAKGEFGTLRTWLRQNIHSKGALHPAHDLIKQVTGQSLSLEPYKAHLTARYAA